MNVWVSAQQETVDRTRYACDGVEPDRYRSTGLVAAASGICGQSDGTSDPLRVAK